MDMKKIFLLPRRTAVAGWILIGLYALLVVDVCTGGKPGGIWISYVMSSSQFNALGLPALVLGMLMVAFSRVKGEDECTVNIRFSSMMIAVIADYVFLLVVYGLIVSSGISRDLASAQAFFSQMSLVLYNLSMFNLVFLLIIYLLVFRISLWRLKWSAKNEK